MLVLVSTQPKDRQQEPTKDRRQAHLVAVHSQTQHEHIVLSLWTTILLQLLIYTRDPYDGYSFSKHILFLGK